MPDIISSCTPPRQTERNVFPVRQLGLWLKWVCETGPMVRRAPGREARAGARGARREARGARREVDALMADSDFRRLFGEQGARGKEQLGVRFFLTFVVMRGEPQ